MKARVKPLPKIILLWNSDDNLELLSSELAKLNIPIKTIENSDTNKPISYLCGFSQTVFEKGELLDKENSSPSMLICGLSNSELDNILKILKENNIKIPLKAIVTPHNLNWCFNDLTKELAKEREALNNTK